MPVPFSRPSVTHEDNDHDRDPLGISRMTEGGMDSIGLEGVWKLKIGLLSEGPTINAKEI